MSLDTFDNLVKEIKSFSHREDTDIKIPTFIALAEQEMYSNPVEVLKIRGQEALVTLTTSGEFLALPDDFQSARSMRLVSDVTNTISFKAPEQMKRRNGTGLPEFFTVTSQIEFNRTPDTDYDVELQYYALAATLTEANQTNNVLDQYPSIYLYGALKHLFVFADDDQMATKYDSLFINAIKGANKKDKQGRYGPAPAMTPAGTVV